MPIKPNVSANNLMPAPKPIMPRRENQPKKFVPSSLYQIGHGYAHMAITAPKGWDFADVMKPIAWANVAARVAKGALGSDKDMVGSTIEVHAEDNAYQATVRVMEVQRDQYKSPNGLKVICIGPQIDPETGKCCPVDLREGREGLPWSGRDGEQPVETAAAEPTGDFNIKWNPGKKRHQVVSKADHAILADFGTKAEAEDWIKNKAA